jgi:hypothetical protein
VVRHATPEKPFFLQTVVLTSGAVGRAYAAEGRKLALNAPVTRTGNGDSWMLRNGIIQATPPELTAGSGNLRVSETN